MAWQDAYQNLQRRNAVAETVAYVMRGGVCPVCHGEGIVYDAYYSGESERCPICKQVAQLERVPSDDAHQRALDRMGPAGAPFPDPSELPW